MEQVMEYVPIRLSTLRPNVNFEFNIYLRLKTKFIKYVHRGDDIEHARLKQLRKNKVRQLFIEDCDEEKYQQFLDYSLEAAATDPNLTAEDKAETASGVAAGAAEDFHEDPESVEAYKNVERASKGIMNIVGKNTDVLVQFYKKVQESATDIVFKHAISTTALAACLAEYKQLPQEEMQNIAAASMVLDIGMVKMPEHKDLFSRDMEEFSVEELKAYKQHPNLSCEVLAGRDYINPRILELVKTHEERKSGLGFPDGIISLDLAQSIVSICAFYNHLITYKGMGHKAALEEMVINQVGNFELDLIQDLKAVIKQQGL